ncbi:hypothetical protein SRABI128_02611 [Microbacterium sp. Bi128]|nr:hypothetical protein SRABI128_02611 [Microbacterium sp. Bi128]
MIRNTTGFIAVPVLSPSPRGVTTAVGMSARQA